MTEVNGRLEASINVLLVDDEASFLEVSKRCLKMEGAFQIDTNLSVDEAVKKIKRKQFYSIARTHYSKDKPRIVHTKKLPLKDKGGKVKDLVRFTSDITERKQVEEDLRSMLKKLRLIFDSAHDMIIYVDRFGKILDVNNRVADIVGYKREEVLGKNFLKLGVFRRRDLPKILKLFTEAVRGVRVYNIMELELKHRNGDLIPVESSLRLIKTNGETEGALSIIRDISKRKKIEEELKNTLKKLEVTNKKLTAMGRLTRHDARNKLQAIIANVYLVKQKLANDREVSGRLGAVESAVQQISRIFDFTRTYEKIGIEELVNIDAGNSFREAALQFPDLLGLKLMNLCIGLTVLADSLLQQVFYNLLDNSLRHGGKISRIKLSYKAEKDQLKLIYEDDGVGIPRTEKKKIFLEGYGKGTGFGLHLIREILNVYGWTIKETGKKTKGAQFTITIPKARENGRISYQLQ